MNEHTIPGYNTDFATKCLIAFWLDHCSYDVVSGFPKELSQKLIQHHLTFNASDLRSEISQSYNQNFITSICFRVLEIIV